LDWTELAVGGLSALVPALLFYLALRKFQRLHPRLAKLDGKQVLEISPNRVMLAPMVFGFLYCASVSVVLWTIIYFGHERWTDLLSYVVIPAIALFHSALTLIALLGLLHFCRSRLFVFNDGLMFRNLFGRRQFVNWSDIVEVGCKEGEIVVASANSAKHTFGAHSNGVAYLFFCFEHFLDEESWREAKEAIERVLRRKGNLDEIRREFHEILLAHPLDAAQAESEPDV
jgi:hypothetical protein